MLQFDSVEIEGHRFQFLQYAVGNAPLLVLRGKRGYVMCGYLDIETADRVGDVAVRVTGVRSLGDMLSATVRSVTGKARELGIREGQSVREILGLIA